MFSITERDRDVGSRLAGGIRMQRPPLAPRLALPQAGLPTFLFNQELGQTCPMQRTPLAPRFVLPQAGLPTFLSNQELGPSCPRQGTRRLLGWLCRRQDCPRSLEMRTRAREVIRRRVRAGIYMRCLHAIQHGRYSRARVRWSRCVGGVLIDVACVATGRGRCATAVPSWIHFFDLGGAKMLLITIIIKERL